MAKLNNLKDLYVEQLKDLYSAETQLTQALPKLAAAAHNPQLKAGFEEHLQQTQVHLQRVQQILEGMGINPGGHTCKAMQGIVAEGQEMIDEDATPEAKDAGLIASAQRAEHYEIAGYGTVVRYAKELGEMDAANILHQTEQEEKDTDAKLTQLAESGINNAANSK